MSTATPDTRTDEFGPGALGRRLASLGLGPAGARLAVALSGGADSAALLIAAAALRATHAVLEVRALHVNHALQPAAGSFVAAARAQAARAGVPLLVLDVTVTDAKVLGVEAAARAARYAAFATALDPDEVLLTAHHEDDQAETVLLQLLRGAGVAGVSAMPALMRLGQGWHARPCLAHSRAALGAYAVLAGAVTIQDPMNTDPRFERVYLRQHIAPRLAARWPSFARTLSRAAGHFAAAQSVLDEVASADVARAAHGAGLRVERLKELRPERQALALRHWLAQRGCRLPNSRRLGALAAMLDAGPAAVPQVRWPGVLVYRHDGCLWVTTPGPAFPCGPLALAVETPLELDGLGCYTLRATGCAAGPHVLGTGVVPLSLARRRGGERLRLDAGRPHRPVKDLLREARIPSGMRERLAFLWCGDDFVGVVTPLGVWVDSAAQAAPGGPGYELDWSARPAALGPSFVEGPRPLP